MNAVDLAIKIISLDEGFRDDPYYCSEGCPTIGYGFRIEGTGKHDPLPVGVHMSRVEADVKLRKLVQGNEKTLSTNPDLARAYTKANDAQKAVMLSIAHQIGLYGLMKFKKFLAAMASRDFKEASNQLLDSLAARQTPQRWKRNAVMIERGVLHAYYE